MYRVLLSAITLAAAVTLCVTAQESVATGDAELQYQLASTLFDQARYREALDAYDKALPAQDATLVQRARKGKVRAALRVAEFDMALQEAETLKMGAASDPESLTLYADALWGVGFFDEADAAYADALTRNASLSRARFGVARSLAMRARFADALVEAQAASAEAPADPEIHGLIGDIYERTYRFDAAADAYEAGAAFVPLPLRVDSNPLMSRPKYLRSFKGKTPMQIVGDPKALRTVPFRLVNKKIVLEGRLNGNRVDFVLDTGSERTTVSRDMAVRSGVTAISTTLTAGIGFPGLRPLSIGRADLLEIGALKIRNVPVSVRAGTIAGVPRWQSETFSPVALGLSLIVDYQRREVTFGRELPAGDADIRLPIRVYRLPMVRGLLNDRHPVYFVVDTGGEMISISMDTAQALSIVPAHRIALRVYGMSGWDRDAFLLPGVNLDFDAIGYRKFGLAVLNLRAPSVLLGFQLGGIVGHRFLSGYRVALDLVRSEMRLQKIVGS